MTRRTSVPVPPRLRHGVRLGVVGAVGVVLALGATPTPAQPLPAAPNAEAPPGRISLPDGFQPEGITTGGNPRAWLGSLADGDIYRVDLSTGRGRVISQGPGTASVGLKRDGRGRRFVAGGDSGQVRVVDAVTGRVLRRYRPAVGSTFINDVVLTPGAVWFTDSANARLYKLTLGPNGGLPRAGGFERVRLRGAWRQPSGSGAFGANGISTTPDGRALLVVNSTSGGLFRVAPRTGVARRVALGGASLTNGDGMLRSGRTLYVVRNRLNRVAVLRLGDGGRQGSLQRSITSPDFDVPTTIAKSGNGLYLPNARFGTEPTPDTPYSITRVRAGR